MSWRVRRAAPADAAALSLVASASFLETFAGILDGADIVAHCAANNAPARFTAWAGDPRGTVSIAETSAGTAPIGYSVLTVPDLPVAPAAGDLELKKIYLLSRFHGSGLGAALMARVIDDAVRLGCRRVLLGVYHGNERARAFYQRQGFSVVGERDFLVGSTPYRDLVYARPI